MRTPRLLFLALFFIVCFAAGPSAARWPSDPVTPLVICDQWEKQDSPAVASNGFGGAFLVWGDSRDGGWNVFAQHVTPWGQPLWDEGGIEVTGGIQTQYNPQVVPGEPATAIVVWMANGTSGWDLVAQKLDAGGDALWGGGGAAVCDQDSGQFNYEVLADGEGGAFVAWCDDRAGQNNWDIYVQHLDTYGVRSWTPDGVAATTATGHQNGVKLASDGQGGVIVGWQDNSSGPSDWHIFGQRIDAAGNPVWTVSGEPVCTLPGANSLTAVVSDGGGGAFFVWQDARSGNGDIYAQRMDAWGHEFWTTDGLPIQATAESESAPNAVSDGAGGMVVAWVDGRDAVTRADIYAQRVDHWGNGLWGIGGVAVTAVQGDAVGPKMIPDGTGGAIVAWTDDRATSFEEDIYARRIDGSGTVLWTTGGVPVGTGLEDDSDPHLASDGAGGAILIWSYGDLEAHTEGDIVAQRVERSGHLGYPSPFITEIMDHPADQGGQVVVSWERSYVDAFPWQEVTHYTVWRRLPDGPEKARGAARDVTSVAETAGLAPEIAAGFAKSGWEYVGQVAASYWDQYGYVAPTYADSTAAGVPITEFQVVAQTDDMWTFWTSPPAAGYSADNLAPGAPLALAAWDVGADVELNWSPSGWHDEDLAGYLLYRGAASGFTPGPGNFVTTVADTTFRDVGPGGGTWYYLVTAADVHGNEGPESNEAAAQIVAAAEDELPARLHLHGAHPNPFNPMTTIRYEVPYPGTVNLKIFDAAGRLLRVLCDGESVAAGTHEVVWTGTDAAGRSLPTGVYFYRLDVNGQSKTRRMTLLK